MKKFLIIVLIFLSFKVNAGKRAVTDEGDIVILNNNGTWEYESIDKTKSTEIRENKSTFKKNSTLTFLIKSVRNNSAIWINPQKWTFKKSNNADEASEYEFERKNMDLYAISITERITVDLENLTQIAFQNAKTAAPDVKIIKREYRIVNGIKVMYMEMDGTIQGIKFSYFGYYYSDKSGSIQLLAYTGSNLAEKYKIEIENFLNGLSTQI